MTALRRYEARSFGAVTVIDVDGSQHPLDPRLDLRNHSPTGFSYGYCGSGCAQLALAILCDVYGDEKAVEFYQQFKFKKIATMRRDEPFSITAAEVMAVVEEIEKEGFK